MAQSAKELEAVWWAGWRKADWSWVGLAAKPVGKNYDVVHGGTHGEADLQAYWRRDPETGTIRDDAAMREAGELVEALGGALWHLAHVPLHWPDGSTAKVGWAGDLRARLAQVIAARVAAAGETRTSTVCNAEEPDRRAQLSGVVLLDAPSAKGAELNLVCDHASLPAWKARDLTFGPGFRCFATAFRGEADFLDATFLGPASFTSAVFLTWADFYDAKFLENIDFNGTKFCQIVAFQNAAFTGRAFFRETIFSRDANFHSAKFEQDAMFFNAIFHGNIELGHVEFGRPDLKSAALFSHVEFVGLARCGSIKFFGDAKFKSTIFMKEADFRKSLFAALADFQSARFTAAAFFDDTTFANDADFTAGEFAGPASFTKAKFLAGEAGDQPAPTADFSARRFIDLAYFTRTEFHRRARFQATSFARLARFDGLVFPTTGDLWQCMFSQTQFQNVASFQGAGCRSFAAFDGAVLGGGLQLDNPGETRSQARFREELAEALRAVPPPPPPDPEMLSLQVGAILEVPPETGREAALRALERGCRVLKQAMEKASDKTREQMFYAFELTARRHQRDTPAWERFFSRAYALTGDYGRSIARPLLFLLATIPLFALFYWLLLPAAQEGWPRIYQSLTLSLGRVFPFGLWQVTGPEFQQGVIGLGDTGRSLAIRGLATLQSLLAIIFAFLAALALRRRFQIS